MICTKCGKELPDNAKFCGYCGTQFAVTPPESQVQEPEQVQAPEQIAETEQIQEQAVQPKPVANEQEEKAKKPEQAQQPPYSYQPQQPDKNSGQQKGGNTGLIFGGVVAAIAVIAMIMALFVKPGLLKDSGDNTTAKQTTEQADTAKSEDSVEENTKEKSKAKKDKKEKKDKKDKKKKKENEADDSAVSDSTASDQPQNSSDLSTTELPQLSDFEWCAAFMDGSATPSDENLVRDTEDLEGSWKGYIGGSSLDGLDWNEGVIRLYNVTMDVDDSNIAMHVKWYQLVDDGKVTKDKTDESDFTGTADANGFILKTPQEKIEFSEVYMDENNERAVGKFTFSDGDTAYLFLTRP